MITAADMVYITLIPKRLEFCTEIAQWRQNNAIRIGAAGRNNAPNDHERAQRLHDFGVPGEATGMLYFTRLWNRPITWNLYDFHRADFEDWIDVKTNQRKYAVNYLIVKHGDPQHWAYVLCFPDPHPRYCLAGWCWGHEAQAFYGDPLGTGRPACFVPQTSPILKPMAQLTPDKAP